MAGGGGAEIDRVLEIVVGEINSLAEPQAGGPHVTLMLGGSVVGGTIIPDWQWFTEVEHAARAGFTVHTGGSIDDEHGGWARLFRGVSESLTRDREERRVVQNLAGGLSERYRRLLAEEDRSELHPPEQCPGARPWRRSRPRRNALAGSAVSGLGVVLRAPR